MPSAEPRPNQPTDMPAPATVPSMEPPKKKRRLSGEAYGSITERKMQDLETSLEVDHMILDYLLGQAIETCLSNPYSTALDNEVSPVERTLLQVDEFYSLFKRRYPKYKLDEEIRFRQQLLQLITLYTQRLTRNCTTLDRASVKKVREDNGARARRWIGDASRIPSGSFDVSRFDSDLPLAQEDLETNRAHVLRTLGAPAEDHQYEEEFYGTKPCISLLDLLPMFMRLTAVFTDLLDKSRNPNQGWLELATDWMVQACLEQYLVFGASGSDALEEAFAWGYKKKSRNRNPQANGEDRSESDDFVNSMFEEDGSELQGWKFVRAAALEKLAQPTQSTDLHTHLIDLALEYPVERTEESVMSFFRGINQYIPKPVLTQLESGKLDGMSKGETQQFMKECGLDLASFWSV